jgi:hypothetical protein
MLTSALNGPSPDGGDAYFSHAPGQHGSLPSPNRRASALPVPGPNPRPAGGAPKPGLVIQGIDNGYWFWGRPSFADLIATCARWHGRSALTGTWPRPARGKLGDWRPRAASSVSDRKTTNRSA